MENKYFIVDLLVKSEAVKAAVKVPYCLLGSVKGFSYEIKGSVPF